MDFCNELVSVIIPVYNAEKTLYDCLKSIMMQTYKNIEIIVINDGSSDNSKLYIEKLIGVDNRIVLIDKENGGVSSARNKGLDYSKGKYIIFVDCDDKIDINFIKESVDLVKKENSELVISGYNMIYCNNKNTIDEIEILPNCCGTNTQQFLLNNYSKLINNKILISCWGKLFLRKYIDNLRFDEDITIGEDMLFVFNYLRKVKNISVLNKIGYKYYINASFSITKNYYHNRQENTYFLYNKMENFCKEMKIDILKNSDSNLKYFFRSSMINLELVLGNKYEYYRLIDLIKKYNYHTDKKNSMENKLYYFILNKCDKDSVYFFILLRKKIKKAIKKIMKN